MRQASKQKRTHSTSELAGLIGVHPNTIRKYEELGFITKPDRKPNGYRVFTDLHLLQSRLVRAAFRVELVQNGLRAEALEIAKASAKCEFDYCLYLIEQRNTHLIREREAAEHAIRVASHYQSADPDRQSTVLMTRSETAHHLSTTIDALRNWEMNGLLSVKRKQNGYRVYNTNDLNRLSIIRALRMANYSLVSIKRLLNHLEVDPTSNIRVVLDTPEKDEDVISVCDQLVTSLDDAIRASADMTALATQMKKIK